MTLALAATLVLALPAAAGASGTPTGDAAAIALERQGVAVIGTRVALTEVVRGEYYWGYSSGSAWRLDAGGPPSRRSYEHAVNDDVTMYLSHGKTVFNLDEFVCPTTGGCGADGSLVIYGTVGHAYWGTTTSGQGLPSCWNAVTGQTEWMVRGYGAGSAAWSVTTGAGYTAQHYLSVARRHGDDVITSSFVETSTGGAWTEVDTMRASSHAFLATTYRAPAAHGHPGFTESDTYSYPSAPPPSPTVNLCGSSG